MHKLIVLVTLLAATSAIEYRRPARKPIELQRPIVKALKPIIGERPTSKIIIHPYNDDNQKQLELEQNKNAKYEFATNIVDNIHDLTNSRHEVRDGLKLVGQYSYSDGFVKRTVHYEADENGYRITKQYEEPLTGPHVDLAGAASVETKAHGSEVSYKIRSVPHDGEYSIEEIL